MTIYSHIVACTVNGTIGKEGTMPWHIPDDLKFFREKTLGKIIIIGSTTFKSLPKKALEGRYYIVVSSSKSIISKEDNLFYADSIATAIEHADKISDNWGGEVFIAGGQSIYEQTFHLVTHIYLTLIPTVLDGDKIYPIYLLPKKHREKNRASKRIKNNLVDYLYFIHYTKTF